MSDSALILDQVSSHIDGFSLSLSLSVRPGELVSIVGPSGCGKTTALSLVCGLLQPDSGRILINGNDVTALDPARRKAALVFQDYALFPNMNVEGNIAYPLKLQKTDRKTRKKRIEELLDIVRMPGFNKRRVNELSGGERQRIAIARAIAASPSVLLLDEPLSALDPSLRHTLRCEIRQIQQELGLTTIYVTHDQTEALSISDRIAIIRDGALEQFDVPQTVYDQPATLFAATFMSQGTVLPYSIIPETLVPSDFDRRTFRYDPESGSRMVFFRPEDVTISDPAHPGPALVDTLQFKSCRVEKVEYEGFRWLLHCRTGNHLIACTSARKPDSPELDLSVAVEKLQHFSGTKRLF